MSGEHPSLVDTNVLVYAADQSAPQYEASKRLLDAGVRGEIALCVAPRVLLEYVSVVTNPKRVSVVSSVPAAWADVETFLSAFPLIAPGATHMGRVVFERECELHTQVRYQVVCATVNRMPASAHLRSN